MEWISVEDRLPEVSIDILGQADEFGIFLGYYDGKCWKEGINVRGGSILLL
ncbi:MAG: hypothetical protein V3T96_04350 [Thermodesulfobacteriota bacterium]